MWFTPQQLSTYDEGYLFDKAEIQTLLDGYRDLMPYINADSLGNQELAVLRNNFKRQSKLVNMLSYRKASVRSLPFQRSIIIAFQFQVLMH